MRNSDVNRYLIMQKFIKTLNIDDFATFRSACMEACNIGRAQWSNWRTGKVAVPAKHHDKINKVATDLFGRVVFED